MSEKPSYYAIIPAEVRYDKELTPNAKLLYAEITSLCNSSGYCWASNSYFAELYETHVTTISRWINQLIKKGYIVSEMKYKSGTKVETRHLSLAPPTQNCYDPLSKNAMGYTQNCYDPLSKNAKDNNKSNNKPNIKKNSVSNKRKKHGEYGHVLLTDKQLETLKEEYPYHWQKLIKTLDEGIERAGYKYKNHLLAIRKWAERGGIQKGQSLDDNPFSITPKVENDGLAEYNKRMGWDLDE